jgi:zinc/manganese transport system substrate-binding protein
MVSRRGVLQATALLAAVVSGRPAISLEAAPDKLKVLATFSILADITRNVGGDRVEVSALVGPDSDAHVYAPAPADVRRVAGAKVVIANGLGFEGWISRLVRASGTRAPVIVASHGVKPLEATDGHGHGNTDPHAWQSAANVKIYVGTIRDALIAADPAGRTVYDANADAYQARLDALDGEIKAAVAGIPADRRKIISGHDAFGYFERAYGIDFIAPVGVSTESEASARDVAAIIRQIRRQKIPAIFLENVADPRLMEQIARETGVRIGGKLYSDALTGAGGAAPTYIELMRHNIRQMAAALTM